MATWYYVENNQQAGPLTDEQLAALVTQGRIQAATLVWNDTMANWQPYAQVRAAAVQRQAEAIATGTPSTGRADALTPLRATEPAAAGSAAAGATAPAGAIACADCGRSFPQDEVIPIDGRWICAGCKPLALQKLREGVGSVAEMDYAGFWIRVGAKVIDGLILFVANLGVGLVIQGAFAAAVPGGHGTASTIVSMVVAWGIQLVLGLCYTVFFLGRFSATPGKLACGLRVVRADGSRISYGRAVGRHFADMLSGLTLCIGYLMVAFDEEKRALHDHICDTRVVLK